MECLKSICHWNMNKDINVWKPLSKDVNTLKSTLKFEVQTKDKKSIALYEWKVHISALHPGRDGTLERFVFVVTYVVYIISKHSRDQCYGNKIGPVHGFSTSL